MSGAWLAQTDRPVIRWEWITDHLDDIGAATLQHLKLVAIAVGVGLAISLPLAVLAHRRRWVYPPITWFTGILYTIPSLALYVLLIPLTGLGTVTAEVALVSYTLLILIRNTVTGLSGVPADVKEAAAGMGYTRRQLLWRVEMPLALPAVMAGIRVATVTTVGLATVAFFIGAGGLGKLISDGLQRRFLTSTLVASVLAVTMALTLDMLLLLAQRLLSPWARRRTAVGGAG